MKIYFYFKKWLRFGKLQYLHFIYVNHKLFCVTNDILNFLLKNIFTNHAIKSFFW